MRIQHNIPAMSSYRNYTYNVSAVAKNLEKLSSGYRINRAGDDAAGLAISEKMRIQITGLEQAQSNAKSGINLVQTAEGALTEVHDMLKRMYTLAEQSANGTYDDDVDRAQLQKEVQSLRSEIDRIADSTNYNGINLLDGSLGGGSTSTVNGLKDATLTNMKDAQVAGLDAQKGIWEVDLSDLKFTATSTDGSATVTISFGGVDVGKVTVGKVQDDGTATFEIGSENATVELLKEQATIAGGTGAKGITVNISYADGKFTIEMDAVPATTGTSLATGMPASFEVKFKGPADAAKADVYVNMSDNTSEKGLKLTNAGVTDVPQATVVQEARAQGDQRLLAYAELQLTADMVKDGSVIKIGNETYTFAVGAQSGYKGGSNVIDLTDIEKKDIATKITAGTVAERLAEAAKDNSQFQVTYKKSTSLDKIFLTEKEDSGLSYLGSAIVGDKSGKGNNTDAKWKGVVMYGQGSVSTSQSGGLTLQIGDTAESFNKMTVSVKDMHSKAMGIGSVDISSQEGASAAMAAIKSATNYVSDVRGDLGALQNRLDHTINNLSVAQQNIQDAESTIRDVDVAQEMMAYTKNNILVQSAQAMLAQANQLPQGVLQLLG